VTAAPSASYNLVVDLGGTRLRAALTDDSPRLLARVEEATDHARGAAGVTDQIARMARSLVDGSGLSWEALGRLVIASPGPLDGKTGVVFSPPNMPGWTTVPLRAWLEERLGLPVKVVNDANAAAVGELHFGAGRGKANLVYLTVSTGIGGGVVVEGKLLEGTSGTAGEIGHMTIDRHGPICRCGNVGCLEMLASGTAIARRYREALLDNGQRLVSQLGSQPEVTAADVARGAAAGDALAASVFADAAEALGTGVVNCIHIFNPDVVALGGGVTRAGPLLFEPVRRAVARYAFPIPRDAVEIVPAVLGEDAGLLGAAAIAVEPGASGDGTTTERDNARSNLKDG